MDTNALIGKVITRSHAIEKLLRKHYPAALGGLHAAIKSAADTLPAIVIRAVRVIANVRNAAAHPDGFKPTTVPPDFDRLCDEIELLIPYFAVQRLAKPKQPTRQCKPIAPSRETAAAPLNDAAPSIPANRGKPWTPEEDKRLLKAFDAQITIAELVKLHQRGVGGIQNRLIKLGRGITNDDQDVSA